MNNSTRFYINPKDEVSVWKALLIGKLILLLLPLSVMVSLIFLSIYLSGKEMIPGWGIGIALVVAIAVAWLLWSLLVIRWKIWAYSRVRNVNELKKRAIEDTIIWPDGHWCERTEISNEKQKQELIKLYVRFSEEDVYEDDPSVPKQLIVKYGKDTIFEIVIAVTSISFGLYFLFFTIKYLVAIFPFIVATIAIFGLNKQPEIKEFLINNEGILIDSIHFNTWEDIENERVYKTGSGSSTEYFFSFFSKHGHTKISLKKYKVKPRRLEKAMRCYRIRYNKRYSI